MLVEQSMVDSPLLDCCKRPSEPKVKLVVEMLDSAPPTKSPRIGTKVTALTWERTET
jgi:hypothetical protein